MKVPVEADLDADPEQGLSESQLAGLWLLFMVFACHFVWTVYWIRIDDRSIASVIFPAMVLGVWLEAENGRWWIPWGLLALASPLIAEEMDTRMLDTPPMSLRWVSTQPTGLGIEVAFPRLVDHLADGSRFGRSSRANRWWGHGSRGLRPLAICGRPFGAGAAGYFRCSPAAAC